MKRTKIITLFAIGAFLIVGLLYAQAPFGATDRDQSHQDEKTKEMLELAHTLYTELGMPDEDMTCQLDYVLETVARDSNDSLMTATAEISYQGNAEQIAMESEEFTLYQDTSVGIAVVPAYKEIRVLPSSSQELRAVRQKTMQGFHTELFSRSEIVESQFLNENEYHLTLVPEASFRGRYGVSQLDVVLLPKERRILSIEAQFVEGKRYESMKMVYKLVDCSAEVNNTDALANALALKHLFEEDGKMKLEYQGYEVIDLRSDIVEQR